MGSQAEPEQMHEVPGLSDKRIRKSLEKKLAVGNHNPGSRIQRREEASTAAGSLPASIAAILAAVAANHTAPT